MKPEAMKPMLAVAAPTEGLRFPLYASAKLDGIRCVIKDGVAMSRKLEPIPNQHVQAMLAHACLEGLDGELTVGPEYADDLFNRTQSAVMSVNGTPDFVYWVFDYWNGPEGTPYAERYVNLDRMLPPLQHPNIRLLSQVRVNTMEVLTAMDEDLRERGFEGLIIRDPNGPYKFGRSTAKQGWMMKIKRFSDGEAEVLDCEELLRNENELDADALGHAKRSKTKDGMVPANLLGALVVRDVETGVPFRIGSGFDLKDRAQHWADHTGQPVPYTLGGETFVAQPSGRPMRGRIWAYKHFEVGVKTAPRFPISKGERDRRDMGTPGE